MSTNPVAALTGPQRNAYTAVQSMLDQFGLGSLAQTAMGYIQQGYDASTIQYLLTQTAQYKQRFSGNDARLKNGLPPLSPADYVATESAYKQVLSSAGIPRGMFDTQDKLAGYIGSDVSPTEFKQRVDLATQHTLNMDNSWKQVAASYGVDSGHLTAWALDPKAAEPVIERQLQAADIGASAVRQGLTAPDQKTAEFYAGQMTAGQAAQGFAHVADVLQGGEGAIASRYGQQYTQQDAQAEFLMSDAEATRKRQLLNSQEAGNFSGQAGVGDSFYHPGFGLAQGESNY